MSPNNILDLHGVKHSQVINKLNQYFFWDRPGYKNYEIITGDSEEMRAIVITWLGEHEYDYYIPPYNTGLIKVTDGHKI